MRVVAWVILMVCLCLGPAGCSLFSKRGQAGGERVAAGEKGKSGPSTQDTNDPLLKAQGPERAGMLAGLVLDQDNNRPADTFIRVVCLDENKQEEPYDIAVSSQGYFTIPNLRQGNRYKLVARARLGDRMLAGTTYATAPNPRLVIKLSENFGGDVPPVPRPSELGKPAPPSKAANTLESPATAQGPAFEPGIGSLTVPQPPRNAGPAQPPPPPPVGFKPQIVEEARPPADPILRTRPFDPPAPPAFSLPTPPAAGAGALVPSCVLVGKQLVNFALPDLSGGNWEWKANRRGKVVLLDFWKTACPPCIATIPNLIVLQGEYGPSGLEVVSIACESDGTAHEQAYRVASMAQQKRTNYKLLMGGGRDNPVVTQFGVEMLPTLVLLNERGEIVWRHEGGLSRGDLEVLRRQIRTNLDAR